MCKASRDGVRVLQHGDCINACTHVHVLYNVYGSSYIVHVLQQVNNVFLSLRWFDSTCCHFFKINIDGIHLEYYPSKKTTPTFGTSSSGSTRNIKTSSKSSSKGRHQLWYSMSRQPQGEGESHMLQNHDSYT